MGQPPSYAVGLFDGVKSSNNHGSYALGRLFATASVILASLTPSIVHAATPPGFRVVPVIKNLTLPTAVRFAPDGRVFVAEKSGIIKVFPSVDQTTNPTVIDLLPPAVYDFWDRGLLGLAIHPQFPQQPYIYVLYSVDAKIPAQLALGDGSAQWGDDCPTPPGPNDEGCVTNSRLSRLLIDDQNRVVGGEQILLNGDWCMQDSSHSIGSIEFGADGALYVSGGDGAGFTFIDHGQNKNLCGDPMNGAGDNDDEGGAFRSQDFLTPNDPLSFDGTILRINPETGNAMSDNPLVATSPVTDDRVIAYGLRNPFRFTFKPNSREVWIGDVGMNQWEEINRIVDPLDNVIENFGWPCYEGSYTDGGGSVSLRHPGFKTFDLCKKLYTRALPVNIIPPFYAYDHRKPVVVGEECSKGGSAVTALAFYTGSSYPEKYKNALFFGDFARECIWTIGLNAEGNPDPNLRSIFLWGEGVGQIVDLRMGPTGDLFYVDMGAGIVNVDMGAGIVNKIVFFADNQPPVASLSIDKTSGPTPLTVEFDASKSTDPDSSLPLSFAWDLDGDGVFSDATGPKATHTYNTSGIFTVGVKVSDATATTTASAVIQVGNSEPVAEIVNPTGSFTWRVGTQIVFAGQAMDKEDTVFPTAAMKWSIVMNHCTEEGCHAHIVKEVLGAGGTFIAPDHDYPSSIELRFSVTDSGGLTHTVKRILSPLTTQATIGTVPSGLKITVGARELQTPLTLTAIEGSRVTVNAASPQNFQSKNYVFSAWSDKGSQTHEVVMDASVTKISASYVEANEPAKAPQTPAPPQAAASGGGGDISLVALLWLITGWLWRWRISATR